MAISDFIIVGVAEFASDEQGFGLETANKALLDSYHNPRRAMLQKVVLTSDYKGCTDFITGVSGHAFCSKDLTAADVAWLKCSYASTAQGDTTKTLNSNHCTDFIVTGVAEVDGGSIGPGGVHTALLGAFHNPRRALLEAMVLSSDHKRCTDFVIAGAERPFLCSKELTSADVLWLERSLGVQKGALFAAARRAGADEASPTELPWEPMARYQAMARTLREPRGSKSAAHLEVLRRSDPTNKLSGWLDWRSLFDGIGRSRVAKLQIQAQIDRALMGHRVATRQDRCLVWPSAEKHEAVGGVLGQGGAQRAPVKSPPAIEPKPKHNRGERNSADSVMAMLEPFAQPAYEPTSPASILEGLAPEKVGAGGWSLDKSAARPASNPVKAA